MVQKLVGSVMMIQVLVLLQGCTLSTQRNEEIATGHEGRAAALTREAIEHAKVSDTEAFSQKAQLALQAAELAHQQRPQPYLEQAITRLKIGVEHGRREDVVKGQKQLSKALQQIETRVADANPNDRQVGTIAVGHDRLADVRRKLGNTPCTVPSASNTTVSYLYNLNGHAYLRLEAADTVQALTLSVNPPLADVCYAPVQFPTPIQTGKGLQLGTAVKEVMRVYGSPSLTLREGPLTRFRYEGVLDDPNEWDVLFRNDRLIEWTVALSE